MNRQKIINRITCVMVALVLAGLPLSSAWAQQGAKVSESYNCVAMAIGTVVQGASRLTLRITRWSTAEEEATLLAAIGPDRNTQALYKALQNQKEVGSIQLQGELAYELRYSREYTENGRRFVELATDRELYMEELFGATSSKEFNVGLIVLELDPESGKGTGEISAATTIRKDEAKNQLIFELGDTQTVKLTQVTKKK